MVNVQQVDKHHDLFKISLAGGFSDPDCEQSTHALVLDIVHICYHIINMCKSKKYGKFDCLNYETIHVQRWYVIIFLIKLPTSDPKKVDEA